MLAKQLAKQVNVLAKHESEANKSKANKPEANKSEANCLANQSEAN